MIILYDTILSFPQEIRCIWRRRFSLVTVSYIIIRYGTLVNTIMNILDAFYVLTSITGKAMYFSFARFPTLFPYVEIQLAEVSQSAIDEVRYEKLT